MKIKNQSRVILIAILFLCANSACHYAPLVEDKTAAPNANVEEKKSDFERDLETMRTANFEYIFVFRRKDNGAFDVEDKKYLRTNKPIEVNRFIATDDDKAFIAGSHYKFSPESLDALRARFNVEDYSAAQEAK